MPYSSRCMASTGRMAPSRAYSSSPRIPYTGSGVTSSAITMDKIMSSHFFKQAGLPMAFSKAYYLKDGKENIEEDIRKSFTLPVVLKPACEGSTIGIEIVKEEKDLKEAIDRVFSVEPRILQRLSFPETNSPFPCWTAKHCRSFRSVRIRGLMITTPSTPRARQTTSSRLRSRRRSRKR